MLMVDLVALLYLMSCKSYIFCLDEFSYLTEAVPFIVDSKPARPLLTPVVVPVSGAIVLDIKSKGAKFATKLERDLRPKI